MKKTSKSSVKKYQTGGTSNTRPVQNAPKYTITPPKPKTTTKPAASKKTTTTKKPATKPTYSAVKDIKSRMYPNTGTPKSKETPAKKKTLNVYAPKPKPKTPTKPVAKTVSQLWTEKTGTPWADAKKQGFTDGTAASNIALMKKLQRGNPLEYTSSGFSIPDEDTANAMDAAYDAAYGPAGSTMRKGGRVKSKIKSKKK